MVKKKKSNSAQFENQLSHFLTMFGNWVSVLAFSASFSSTLLAERIGWVNNIITSELLKLCFISPKSSTCKELQDGKPLKSISAERNTSITDIEKNIAQDPNMTMSGVHHEVLQVLRGLFRQPASFFLNSMDAIIISKMGVEVLILKFPEAKYDRCIYIELTGYRSLMLQFSVISSVACGVMAALLADRKEVKNFMSLYFGGN